MSVKIAEQSDEPKSRSCRRVQWKIIRRDSVIASVICLDPLVKPLTHKQFDKLARELFGVVLSPRGFSCELSRHCTFTRQISDDIIHVIMPDPGTRCAWYDIHVFPTSPRLYGDFAERFPDSLGNTLDVWGKLSETAGIGMDQQQFNCKYESNMRSRFEKTVAGLLVNTAIPFLDTIRTYDDMLPHLRGPFARFNGK